MSTNFSANTTADKAVNGDANGGFPSGSVSATDYGLNSWWQVDLQSVQTVNSITVWGRTDCCPEMSTDFYVFVSNNPFTSTDLNTTLNQPGVSNYHYTDYAGPASLSINRTGRYVRVQIVGTMYLVLGEVQVWTAAAKVNWLVADQLGTPRLIVDLSGSFLGISRHDYLPYGEEVPAGLRNGAAGYSGSDGVRQKFTKKQRDNETGLDFFEARYFSSTQGRFTSPDPYNIILETQATAETNGDKAEAEFFNYLGSPQNWNRYAYVQNSPLKYTDPTGEQLWLTGTADERKQELDRIKNLVGKSAAKYLTTTELCTKDGTVTVVGYSSNAFSKHDPGVTTRLADIIDKKDVVEYHTATTFEDKNGQHTTEFFGGAATVGKEESLTGNTQIFVNPSGAAIAQDVLGVPTMLAASRSDDGKPLDFFDDIVDFHEFGHAYANVIDKVRVNSEQSNKRACDFENVTRERRGLPNRRVAE